MFYHTSSHKILSTEDFPPIFLSREIAVDDSSEVNGTLRSRGLQTGGSKARTRAGIPKVLIRTRQSRRGGGNDSSRVRLLAVGGSMGGMVDRVEIFQF